MRDDVPGQRWHIGVIAVVFAICTSFRETKARMASNATQNVNMYQKEEPGPKTFGFRVASIETKQAVIIEKSLVEL